MRTRKCILLSITLCTVYALAQEQLPSLENYFIEKQVLLKLDMPGSQKGIDLRFNKPTSMDWKEYSKRLRDYGIAIHS